ncbi:efflux RND transporter permease subunit [Frigidibacter sp. ROC022]|uniref:efflux RND transporter permease subunit n=1 Tax=Frigidibacter sp. ROC022 TaxID=2971796 RepID=UPI00215A9385|nr:efflux RND transporter permease subunit [Frigidibacter sp. ROC022]MCR8722858.1 efflux RND transporter permease subunit [Frigidibacter sp. ROC022]
MNFSAWAIRNPVAPLLAFFMLLVIGWQSFNALPITRFPNIDVPFVAVSVAQPGAAPAEIEAQVTKEIEDAVAGITGVKNVQSTITDGVSTTAIEFRMEVPTDKAVQDVKDAIDGIRGNLPGEIEAPIVSRIDVEGQAIMTFAVSAPNMSIEELSWFVDDVIKRRLQGKPGIGRIDRFGGADREIRVELDPTKLDSYGITAAAVSQQLRLTNANVGSGRSEVGDQEQAIRTLGDAATVEKLANTTIALPSGRFVKLENLGRVIDTYEELRSFSRFNGEQVVTFAVFRAKGASEVSVAEVTHEVLDELAVEHPEVAIKPVDDTVGYTEGNYEAAIDTLLEGAILAVLVVLLFLRNWRATLISAVALPLSAIPTFWAMDMLGFSLNLVSFLAITLATGILVDDAIVEIENISRHIKMGKTPYRAAIDAADEIGLAVIATTSTIVAVFVPVSFMPGIPGQYFRQFGLTVAIAVLFSLLVARLITPLMAAYLMRTKDAHGGEGKDGLVMRGYSWVVRKTTAGRLPPLPNPLWLLKPVFGRVRGLRRLVARPLFRIPGRYATLGGAVGTLVVSLYFMAQVPGSFLPPEDVSRIPISVELPPGATLEETDAVTEEMRQRIVGIDGIKDVFVLGGSSPTGQLDVRRASFTVLLDGLDHTMTFKLKQIGASLPLIGKYLPPPVTTGRTRPQNEIEADIFAAISDIPDIRAYKLNDRGERDISFSILSSNEAELSEAVAKLEAALRGDPLLANVAASGALPRPEIQIIPREGEAARMGVSTRAIADTVRVATIGDVDAALAKISLDGRQVPVRVQLSDDVSSDLGKLGALKIATATGKSVPLDAVAELTVGQGPSMVDRLNRERRATIGANLPPGVPLGTATARFQELVSSVDLPPSVRVAEAGDAEVLAEMQQSFVNAMVMGLMLVLTVLILLFRSVIQPFTILLSLPLAIGGVAGALILTANPMSMPVMIGLLMLMGIVTKNAILLVDFGIEMRNRGLNRYEAMVEAGRKRARPIVMTSIAMSAGMLPSALGVGEGGSFRSPMAIAVIGGIIVSTVLSLVVVPAFFLIMDDLSNLLGRVFGGLVGKKEVEPVAQDNVALGLGMEANRTEIEALKDRLHDLELGRWAAQTPRHVAE